MNNIDVFIYSYKGKYLKDVVNQLFKTAKNNISVQLFDQNPIDRHELFDGIPNFKYKNIVWDLQKSPCVYKNNFIKRSRADYVLILSDNVLLSEGWDERFINFINNDIVISGSGNLNISKRDNFYINKNISESSLFNLTNYINRDFIFSKRSTMSKIDYPYYMKYNGEEEVVSALFYCSGVDIYSAPTKIYSKIGDSPVEHLYVPFSLDHLYNDSMELLITGKNKYSIPNTIRTIDDFEKFHKFVFKDNLVPLPFLNNDVEYDQYSVKFGNIGGSKFIDKVKKVE